MLKDSHSLRLRTETQKSLRLLPKQAFNWIKKDERQIRWLTDAAMRKAGFLNFPGPSGMTGSARFIFVIDAWDAEISTKDRALRDLERNWNEHLQSDRVFMWFKQENELQKCLMAWDWLENNKPRLTRGMKPLANHDELLVLFDHSNATADEKKLYVELIKRRWNSQKSRENQPDKKQYNFTLSTRVVSLLDTLADTHNLTRPKILEALIKMESKTGLYLGDREGNQMKPR